MSLSGGSSPKAESKSVSQEQQQLSSERPTILVVDDNPGQQKLFALIGEAIGVDAHIVGTCKDAVAASAERKYDIILMDIIMPDQDGYTCTRCIRDLEKVKGRYTPIIAVTANVMAGMKETCLKAGMDDYVSKPFTIAELKEKLQYWLEKIKTEVE